MKNREVFSENEEKRTQIRRIVLAAWENKEKEHFNRFALSFFFPLAYMLPEFIANPVLNYAPCSHLVPIQVYAYFSNLNEI